MKNKFYKSDFLEWCEDNLEGEYHEPHTSDYWLFQFKNNKEWAQECYERYKSDKLLREW